MRLRYLLGLEQPVDLLGKIPDLVISRVWNSGRKVAVMADFRDTLTQLGQGIDDCSPNEEKGGKPYGYARDKD